MHIPCVYSILVEFVINYICYVKVIKVLKLFSKLIYELLMLFN